MLNRYYVDASGLSINERDKVYSDLESICFITNIDLRRPGCYEAFLEDKYDLKSLITFPDSCIVTRL